MRKKLLCHLAVAMVVGIFIFGSIPNGEAASPQKSEILLGDPWVYQGHLLNWAEI